MLSKEECEKAIDSVARYCSDYRTGIFPPRFELTNELNILCNLIKEHFELIEEYKDTRKELECHYEMMSKPQPYKFEDLKEVVGKPIYDKKYKEFYILAEVKEEEVYKDEGIEKFMICSDKNGLVRVWYEENRFYPVQMANEVIEDE